MNPTESPKTTEYFQKLKQESNMLHEIATRARKKGIDPEEFVEVKLAENLAERVIGLISAVAPKLGGSGAISRIIELENKWSPLDWRVGMQIAYEISQQKFCEFKDKQEAMEVGIRTGFAYVTLGVVSAPLEGFTSLEIKKRLDGKEYFCINYAGPVRAAGGTAAAVSVLIADYVRKKNGYDIYDPTEKEIKRCAAEIEDYHEYITNLQYFPSKQESEFLMKNLPVEISGDPSEKYEISSALLKDLPRIPTNVLRSGYCLIHSACIPLKGPKLWKQLRDWASEMDMDHWNFMEEFVKLQTSMKSKGAAKKDEAQLYPDYTYIKDLVGGRPVLGHPIRNGAFRLRYGRTRTSGFSAQAVHPATMYLLNKFLAIGTQLKVERPGKAAAFSSCNTIDGPIVLLNSGEVLKVDSIEKAKEVYVKVKEIVYTGDVLINYGDFYDRAHKLVPAGYCQEIWIQELEKSQIKPSTENISNLFKNPMMTKIGFDEALKISKEANIPMHPDYTYYWNTLTKEQLQDLIEGVEIQGTEILIQEKAKRPLELIGIPHVKDKIVGEHAKAIATILKLKEKPSLQEGTTLEIINKISPVVIKDKAGTFIGSRMGRPEKAKMRKLTGSPHTLFPIGEEGGRLKSFQSALEAKKITEKFQIFDCECGNATPLRVCEKCKSKTTPRKQLVEIRGEKVEISYEETSINIVSLMEDVKKQLDTNIIPDLIKGVRGTWNPKHVAEHLAKGVLRAKHDVFVNKDGTVRYDCSELPITHFRPREIGVTLKQLKELGYDKDIHGENITSLDQTIEIKVQDIIIPCSDESGEPPADQVLFNVSKFIDESLEKIYELPSYYNLKSKQDLVGQLAVGLAPHTSAGTVMRIIGFSKTQAFYAHPYMHAAMRRDCDGDEACMLLLLDAFLNFSNSYLPSSRGSTMDAPLVLTSRIQPSEVDDMIFNMDIAWKYPLELYDAAAQYKMPYDVKIPLINNVLGTPDQYENMGFTHDTEDLNEGVLCSAYKTLPSMSEKVDEQMNLAVKIRAVDQRDVARLIIDKHFIRDTKGNLRKFSLQQFRCVHCNEKYRRPPLMGKCVNCSGKVIFTISEGSVIKYMEYSLELARKYDIDFYSRQVIELTQKRIEGVFGKDPEKQLGLSDFT